MVLPCVALPHVSSVSLSNVEGFLGRGSSEDHETVFFSNVLVVQERACRGLMLERCNNHVTLTQTVVNGIQAKVQGLGDKSAGRQTTLLGVLGPLRNSIATSLSLKARPSVSLHSLACGKRGLAYHQSRELRILRPKACSRSTRSKGMRRIVL